MVRIFSYHEGSKYQSYRGNAGFNGGKGGGAPKINVAKSLSPSSDPGGLVTRSVEAYKLKTKSTALDLDNFRPPDSEDEMFN